MRKTLSVVVTCIATVLVVTLVGCAASAVETQGEVVPVAESNAKSYSERLESCKEQIRAIYDVKPDIAIVLGTGLGDYVDSLDVKATIPYEDIEGWPVATAPQNDGNLVFAEYKGLNLAIMQGRIHYYEGYTMQDVVLPLRVLHLLGADTAILTNAVGSLNPEFRTKEFVVVEDQIASFIPSPLVGENLDELGDRFVDMTDAFDKDMRDTVLEVGERNDIPVHTGVYLEVTGPQYETLTEVEMYRSFGADTIAMSLSDEVLAARHMDMRICAINCISNMAAGLDEEGFTEDSIEATMDDMVGDFTTLTNGLLDSLVE